MSKVFLCIFLCKFNFFVTPTNKKKMLLFTAADLYHIPHIPMRVTVKVTDPSLRPCQSGLPAAEQHKAQVKRRDSPHTNMPQRNTKQPVLV